MNSDAREMSDAALGAFAAAMFEAARCRFEVLVSSPPLAVQATKDPTPDASWGWKATSAREAAERAAAVQ